MTLSVLEITTQDYACRQILYNGSLSLSHILCDAQMNASACDAVSLRMAYTPPLCHSPSKGKGL